MYFEKNTNHAKFHFANHDFEEIKSCRKANHILNISMKLIHRIKLMIQSKAYVIVIIF